MLVIPDTNHPSSDGKQWSHFFIYPETLPLYYKNMCIYIYITIYINIYRPFYWAIYTILHFLLGSTIYIYLYLFILFTTTQKKNMKSWDKKLAQSRDPPPPSFRFPIDPSTREPVQPGIPQIRSQGFMAAWRGFPMKNGWFGMANPIEMEELCFFHWIKPPKSPWSLRCVKVTWHGKKKFTRIPPPGRSTRHSVDSPIAGRWMTSPSLVSRLTTFWYKKSHQYRPNC